MKIIPIFLCLLVSCASIKIDESKGTYEYSRFGNQELHGIGIVMEKDADGSMRMEASLNRQKSEREIAEVLLAISENIDKALEILMQIQAKFPGIN